LSSVRELRWVSWSLRHSPASLGCRSLPERLQIPSPHQACASEAASCLGFHSIFRSFGFQDYKPTHNPSSRSCFQRKKNTLKSSYPISGQFSKQKERQRWELLAPRAPQALLRSGLPPAPGSPAAPSRERESACPTFASVGCGGVTRSF